MKLLVKHMAVQRNKNNCKVTLAILLLLPLQHKRVYHMFIVSI